MRKYFYVSGFLYHSSTRQILLHKSNLNNNPLSTWNIFSGISRKGEDAQTAFRRITYERVKIRLEADCLFPVYDYFYNALKKINYVFYAEVKKLYTFPLLHAGVFSWFTFKSTRKLAFSDQVKHDVLISERVINAQLRSREPIILSFPKQYPKVFY